MRMRVLARVVKMVAATDGTAIAIARLLRDRFLMSPCRVLRLRCRVLVLSSSRLSLVASRSSPDTSVVVRGFLEGGVGPKGPRASDRSIDRPTTLPTAVARARRPHRDRPSPRGGCCGRVRQPRRPYPAHAHRHELVMRCAWHRAAAAVVARGRRARTCAQTALSSCPFTDVESMIIIVT
jgi:hypothetical protein